MKKKIMTLMAGMLLLLTACGQTRDNSTSTMLPVERAETLENADAEAENQPMWPAAAHPSSRCWSVCGRIRS